MAAVWMRLRAELRARWRATLALAVAPGGLVVANLVAALPARAAAHTQPAVVLRTE